ncbi:MAG: L-aspartate oxidase [Gemmatimonadota bacterium]
MIAPGSAPLPLEATSRVTASAKLIEADAVVVGSGVAGLSAALALARNPVMAGQSPPRVLLLTRGRVGSDGATPWAQGGVAAAMDPRDSPLLHAQDTMAAGGGMVLPERAMILTGEGPTRVRQLLEMGAQFDRDSSGKLVMAMEGAHSRRRILHAGGDRTGAEIARVLVESLAGSPGVDLMEGLEVVDLLLAEGRVQGVLARDSTGGLVRVVAPAVLLATGGCSRLYLHSTAPPGVTGAGLALASRAGARLVDMEFIQFHPTALAVDADPLPLISEAVRGEGAVLVDEMGTRILAESGGSELDSRDRVSRAIWEKLQQGHAVFLDTRQSVGSAFPTLFPAIHAMCIRHGVDPVKQPIPVTPAAHYHMGGIQVDSWGRSSLPGLWAAGEVASAGVHGANRLASNSLLEGLVFGSRAGASMAAALSRLPRPSMPPKSLPRSPLEMASPQAFMDLPIAPALEASGTGGGQRETDLIVEVRTILWEKVGIVRTDTSLREALAALQRVDHRTGTGTPLPLRNALEVARLITRSALKRRESRGSHYRADFPPVPKTVARAIPA